MSESHRKKHIAWEQLLQQKPHLDQAFHSIASVCPDLTKMELRVCVLVREGLYSWEIAANLNVSERTIETHRYHAHKKITEQFGNDLSFSLSAFLRSLII
ncbi:MAG TPA: helix-turn-helix transcriptional regulator [Candidatus Kapabacteria bacterium]|nr:helix-turn-helix transcriptional regulator [Candidatus Kapabacteria bacterium]